MRTLWHRFALAAVFLAAAAITPAGQAAFPGKNGEIAFAHGGDIWVMQPDGTGQLDLTNTPAVVEGQPAWSPDGTQIAFSSGSDIWVMNANGTEAHSVVVGPADEGSPTWSPDGSHMAFFRSTGPRAGDIYVVASDGSGETRLSNGIPGSFPFDGSPAWCETGDTLIFGRVFSDVTQDLFRLDPAVGWLSAVQITNRGVIATAPNCSPDASKIVLGFGPAGGQDVAIVNVDGSNFSQVTNSAGQINGEPAWSPDGNSIVFTSHRDGRYQVYTMNADGSQQVRLTSDATVDDHHPDWQPLAASSQASVDASVNVVPTPLQVSVQSAVVAFGDLSAGTARYAVRDPVTVVSGHDAGYALWVTRTPFAQPNDIPLAVRCAEAPPAGATCDPRATGSVPGLPIPTTSSLLIAHRAGSTPPGGDVLQTDLILGPIPPIAPQLYRARITFTAVGF